MPEESELDRSGQDVLVLGGTSWLGGAVARVAADRGHRVTCLARGASGTVPAGVDWVRADRAEADAYAAVRERHWDVVVDVSWQPDFVRSAVAALADRTDHWVYVSSCSVYADDSTPDTAEDAPTHRAHTGTGPVDIELYGPAKVACEQACLQAMGVDRVLIARAGLIVGYGDRSDRFGYWPARVARARDGEAVLVPSLDAPTQVIDVEDLARWLVRSGERRIGGAYNAVGDVIDLRHALEAVGAVVGRAPGWVEVDDSWLEQHGVDPWAGPESLPLWLPRPQYAGFTTRRNSAARAAGLALRPLHDTVADALRWEVECGTTRERKAGLTPTNESRLLAEAVPTADRGSA
jgi:2'-hydroxyisoflavone reductase